MEAAGDCSFVRGRRVAKLTGRATLSVDLKVGRGSGVVVATMGWVENLKRYGLQGTVDLSGEFSSHPLCPPPACLASGGEG